MSAKITTIVAAIVSTLFIPWLVKHGINLTGDSQVALDALLVGAVVGAAHWVHDKVNPAKPAPLPPPASKAAGFVRWEGLVTVFALAVVAVGCTALGITKSLTFNEKLAAGYQADTAVITATDQLLVAGKITKADANNVEAQANNLKAALDIASQVEATDVTTGGNKLAAALTALQALTSYVATLK
jgi:hypothetical protein